MDIGVHAFYLCELFLPEPVTAVSAVMRYADSGVDDHAFCTLRTGTDRVARVDIAWGQGSSRFEIGGTKGFISYVYDEGAGYFGSPMRAVRVGSVEETTVVHKVPRGRAQFTPRIYDDLAGALGGATDGYPAYGRHGRPRGRDRPRRLPVGRDRRDGTPAARGGLCVLPVRTDGHAPRPAKGTGRAP